MDNTRENTGQAAAGDASRTRNSTRNAMVGVVCQAATMILAFIGRGVFLHILGEEYAGISGWFSRVLSILAISELGIGTAIVVSLYKPIASGDLGRIRATLRFLRRAYLYVGLAVLVLGLALFPFLHLLLNQDTDLVNLRIVYAIYLAQSISSYLFYGYKSAVFTASQQQSRIYFLTFVVSALTTGAQMLSLVLWRNYYVYVGIFALSSVAKNLLIARSTDRAYPELKNAARLQPGEDDEQHLPKAERKNIFRNLFGLSLYRISGTVMNSTSTLVLGKFQGFALIGLYDTYLLVITAITTILTLVFQSFTASVGNLNVTASPERKHFIFRCLNLLGGWLYGFSAVCLFVLIDPFIALAFGQARVFTDGWIVLMLVLNFLTSGLLENVIMHKDACGLFWQGRFRPVFSTALNIGLSIWWVTPLGLVGVILAQVASRLLTTWWFDPWMVHHYALKASVKGYALQTGLVMLLTAGLCAALKALSLWLFPTASLGGLLVMMAICAVLPNALFFLVFRRWEEFAYLKAQGLTLWGRIRARV